MPDWETLTHAERDALIATEIMGRPGAYTTDLAVAYELADEMIRRGCVVSVWQGPHSLIKYSL